MTRWREAARWPVAALALNCAAFGSAAESPNAIATAKRDLKTISESAAGVGEQPLTLPRQSLPTLESSPPAPPPPGSPHQKDRDKEREALKQREKSENWLIEAMTKTAAAGETDAPIALPDAPEQPRVKGDLLAIAAALEREEKVAEKTKEARAPREAELTAANPLANYMAGWLSSRDLALSAPVADTSPRNPTPSPDFNTIARGAAVISSGGAKAIEFADAREPGAAISSPTNPYLEFSAEVAALPSSEFAMPAPEMPNRKPANAVPSFLREPARGTDAASPLAPNSLSETLRTQDDAKYFKQLKRF